MVSYADAPEDRRRADVGKPAVAEHSVAVVAGGDEHANEGEHVAPYCEDDVGLSHARELDASGSVCGAQARSGCLAGEHPS